jgi:polysaccharide export outer membrane protein
LNRGPWLVVLLLSIFLAGSAFAGGDVPGKPLAGVQMGSPDSLTRPGAATDSAEYRVGPQDLLEISVFQVAELSRTVRVSTSGEVSLPLIGIVHAGGRTVHEVERDITDRLGKGYLQNPQVSVFVKEFTSQRVTLEGAVQKPGIYPLTGQTSLLQAIAMAQGLSDLADPRGVVVFRVIDGQKKAAAFDLRLIRKGKAEDPKIYGDDIVVVEQSGSRSLFSRIIKAMPILGAFTIF